MGDPGPSRSRGQQGSEERRTPGPRQGKEEGPHGFLKELSQWQKAVPNQSDSEPPSSVATGPGSKPLGTRVSWFPASHQKAELSRVGREGRFPWNRKALQGHS